MYIFLSNIHEILLILFFHKLINPVLPEFNFERIPKVDKCYWLPQEIKTGSLMWFHGMIDYFLTLHGNLISNYI